MASYNTNQLKGAGTPTETLSGNKTFAITSSGDQVTYFTMETVRNSNGFYVHVSIFLMTKNLGIFWVVLVQSPHGNSLKCIISTSATMFALAMKMYASSLSFTFSYEAEASAIMKFRKMIQVISTIANQMNQNKIFSSGVK